MKSGPRLSFLFYGIMTLTLIAYSLMAIEIGPHLSLDSPSFSEISLVCVLSSSSFTELICDSGWRVERITASSRNSGRTRESTPTTGAPVLVQSQGRLLREGAGASPDHGGPDHTPHPRDPGGGLDLRDLAPGWIMMLQWRRPNSF